MKTDQEKENATGRRRQFEREVARALGEHRHHRLLATVSGGADSVALLRSLAALHVDVVAAHCNFHLRGEESDRDEQFVSRLAQDLGIALETVHFDVEASRMPGESDEMACRRLRYDWFDSLTERHGCARIVTGHNADDNAETLMLNLMRGSGISGLRGMVADTGRILRPLLRLHRSDITGYLASLRQDYVTDSTNLTSDYRRNFIRLEIIPLLETRWPGARTALARTIDCLAAQERIVEKAIAEALSEADSSFMPIGVIRGFADPATLLLRYTASSGGKPETAAEMAYAADRPSGQRWALEGSTAVMLPDGLHLYTAEEIGNDTTLKCEEVSLNPEIWREIKRSGKPDTLWLPLPLDSYTVRTPEEGDRMEPLGMRGSRLLSDIMKEARIPQPMRRKLKVVADSKSGHIIWLEGLKRSRHGLVAPDATMAYKVSATRN